MLKTIDEWWGIKHCSGGDTKACTDCSAFAQMLMSNVYNIQLPRTAEDQYRKSDKIDEEDLKEGDLVFFNTGGRSISHVGVYMMNNKFVHASSSQGVIISDLNEEYWKHRYKAAGRVKS